MSVLDLQGMETARDREDERGDPSNLSVAICGDPNSGISLLLCVF